MTSEGQRGGVTPHQPDLEVFPGATVRSHWTGKAAAGHEEIWAALVLVPGMTCLTADPEEITLLQHQEEEEDLGAQMMRPAAGEEEEEGEEEVEAGLTNHLAIGSMSPDRNQEHGRMNATLTRVLAVAPASSSEPFSCETPCDLWFRERVQITSLVVWLQ